MFSQIDPDILQPGLCSFTDRMLVHIQNLAQNSVSYEMVWLIFEYFPRPNAFSWHGIGQFWDKWIPKFKIHPTAFVPCTNCLKCLIFRYSFSQIPYRIVDSKFRRPFVGTVVPCRAGTAHPPEHDHMTNRNLYITRLAIGGGQTFFLLYFTLCQNLDNPTSYNSDPFL